MWNFERFNNREEDRYSIYLVCNQLKKIAFYQSLFNKLTDFGWGILPENFLVAVQKKKIFISKYQS